MSILFLMIPVSLFLVFGFLILFLWSNNNGQFDDLESPPHKMLENESGEA